MANREELKEWVIVALRDYGGRATLVEVAKHIWDHHEGDLRASDDLFYKWQYDMRWAAMVLRKEGVLKASNAAERVWQLN